jgi:hypothetical protein
MARSEEVIPKSITLYAELRGRSLKISDVIVDTRSSHTVISPDILEKIRRPAHAENKVA